MDNQFIDKTLLNYAIIFLKHTQNSKNYSVNLFLYLT